MGCSIMRRRAASAVCDLGHRAICDVLMRESVRQIRAVDLDQRAGAAEPQDWAPPPLALPGCRLLKQEDHVTHLRTSLTLAGLACSALLSVAIVTVSSEPAGAVVYCQYIDYP